nr:hypothetical protein [Halomonas sp.]
MQNIEPRKAYEAPAVVAIGSMAEKTEFSSWFQYLMKRKIEHWQSKKPVFSEQPEYS